MDVLSDVMRAVRLGAALYFDVRASEPFVAQTPNMSRVGHLLMPGASNVVPFHIMLRGKCWVEAIDGEEPPAEFGEGDIVFYPHGHAHIFVTHRGDRLPPDMAAYERAGGQKLPIMMELGGQGPPSLRFVCGYLACDTSLFNPLLEALPSQVLARRPPRGNHIEVDLIHEAIGELEVQRAGGDAMLARLSELLFVRVLRRYIENLPEHSSGWLAGLRDPNISRALQAIHREPAREWTLEDLARESGMSRAVFAERFTRCIGETATKYLAKWRMQLAVRLLEQPGLPIEVIAERVGYRSEASFNRAFKAIVGIPPGTWRRRRAVTGEQLLKPSR